MYLAPFTPSMCSILMKGLFSGKILRDVFSFFSIFFFQKIHSNLLNGRESPIAKCHLANDIA